MNKISSLPPEILSLPLEVRAEMAMKAAFEKVVEEHIRSGRPLHIMRDGEVVAVSAEELRKEKEAEDALKQQSSIIVYHCVTDIYTEINNARKRLCDGLPELNPEQARFKPAPDEWSVAEILEHLAKVDRALVTRIDKKLVELEQAGPGNGQSRSFFPFSMDHISKQAKDRKFKSPEPALPLAGLAIDESLTKLQSSRADLIAMQPRIEARNLSDTTFPHFVFGELNLYQWLAFFGLHENRHRKQIDRLISAADFPTR